MNKEITLVLPVDPYLKVLLKLQSYKKALLDEISCRVSGDIERALKFSEYRKELERWWSGSINIRCYGFACALIDIYRVYKLNPVFIPNITAENTGLSSSEKATIYKYATTRQELHEFLVYAWSLLEKYRELKFKMMYQLEDQYYTVLLMSIDDYRNMSEDQLKEWNVIEENNNDDRGEPKD